MESTKTGFTLIELLVVVLIIGILASVALPQYQLAVIKSKTSAYFPLMRAIANAETVYYLANGEPSLDVSKLDVDVPQSCTPVAGHQQFACGTDFLLDNSSYEVVLSYCPQHNSSYSECSGHRDFAVGFYNNGYNDNANVCVVQNDSKLGQKICKVLNLD